MAKTKNKSATISKVAGVSDLLHVAGGMPAKTIVIPGGHREDDLRLVESARDLGIVKDCLLVGDSERITSAINAVGINVSRQHIHHTASDEETAAKTIALVQAGKVDVILKGDISTPILNRAILKLRTKSTMGLVTMFDAAPIADNRTMFLTDPGVTTECTYGRLVDLIENAAEVARTVAGISKPRVALLSANEKVIPSLRSSVVAAELTKREWRNMYVYGPLSFDLATDLESVRLKGVPHGKGAADVAGKADILVCPTIDTANAVYKTIMAMVKFGQASMAGVTVGVQVPYVILSRSDPIETKLDSIAMCCVYAERLKTLPATAAGSGKKRKSQRILTINPGSTSTKIGVFDNETCTYEQEIAHTTRNGMLEGRVSMVQDFLSKNRVKGVTAIVGRGGFLKRPRKKISGGTYQLAEVKGDKVVIKRDLVDGVTKYAEMDHASNLGIPMAADFARRLKAPAYVVDPVVVDEFSPEAEISGYAPITRKSTSHALSIKAATTKFAQENSRTVGDVNIVVGHLGGGITIAAIRDGRMVDNSIALLGEGPFTPQRTGTLPLKEIIDLCYDGGMTKTELLKEITKKGGLVSYLGEDRVEKIAERVEKGDAKAASVLDAMAYQISKEIGAMAVAVGQRLEGIVLTGGLTRSAILMKAIRKRVGSLGQVVLYRGSLEMQAMALGALRVLSGQEKPMKYSLK